MQVTERTERRTYTAEQAGRMAGIGRSAFYDALLRGEIPGALRVGRLWLISKVVFDAWLDGESGQ